MKDQLKAIALALFSIAAILGLAWFFIDSVVSSISRLQSSVAGSIIAASIAAVAAFLVNVYVKHRESKERIIQEIRAKKTPVYEELIDIIFSSLLAKKQGKMELTQEDIAQKFAQITPKIVIWGSEELITKWNDIRGMDWTSRGTALEVLKPWDEFLLIIRKDLGHPNRALGSFALMRLFVNDFPKELEAKPASRVNESQRSAL